MQDEDSNGRFVDYEEEQIDEIQEEQKNNNTMKSDKKCEKIFMDYLQAMWHTKVDNFEYWNYPTELLDKILRKFWFAVRQKSKDYYTVSSLKHLRYAPNRCLKK